MKPTIVKSIGVALFFVGLTGFLSLGCSKKPTGTQTQLDERVSPDYEGPEELSYCSTVQTYPNPAVITGTAQFKRRELTSKGLGAPGSAIPIRHAEIRVTGPNEAVVQCGETDASGNFSLTLPRDSYIYTISINARADNNMIKISVLNAPEKNNVYSLSISVVADQSKSVGTLIAQATGDILGGAFNIYNLVLTANDYLRTQVGSCSEDIDNCVDFKVAPKVTIYWEKGFNPNAYFNGIGGLSFYWPSKNRLFILGGINGDTDSQDTDHFDTSIVLHEYGHFIEDQFSITNSPGGEHSGNRLIDPRLALGEGWGNFFQAAIQYATSETSPKYIDTVGNEDGSMDMIFNIDLESPDPICVQWPRIPGCDQPELPHEGNFREFSVARFLWDTIDTVEDHGDNITGGFPEIWAALTSGNGYHNPHVNFRSIGFMHQIQSSLSSGGSTPITNWDPLRALDQHRHLANRSEYALYVDDTGHCEEMNFRMDPYNFPEDNGGLSSSHLLRNNDFFHFHHPINGDLTLTLRYKTNGLHQADLDLYLYNSQARFGVITDIVDQSLGEPSDREIESEEFTIEDLPAGDYLINVNLHVDKTNNPTIGDSTVFELLGNKGARICPTDIP